MMRVRALTSGDGVAKSFGKSASIALAGICDFGHPEPRQR